MLLDGNPIGVAPLEMQGVSAGTHTLELQSPSGKLKRTIVIKAGGRFIADEAISPGYLSILSKNDIEIHFDSIRIGT